MNHIKLLYKTYYYFFSAGDDVDECTRNESIWRYDPIKRCPETNAFVPILLAVYMILTNILLVNLLIAMFRYKT